MIVGEKGAVGSLVNSQLYSIIKEKEIYIMSRFYDPEPNVINLMESVIHERFPALRMAKIKVLMDGKPKIDKIRRTMTFAYIKLANEVERYLTKDGHNLSGVDYIMFLCELPWSLADAKSKKRIVSHELRHCFVDEEGNYKVVRHDIEDFYEEVKLNAEDPMWGQALSTIAMAKFEQLKAEEKAAKKGNNVG